MTLVLDAEALYRELLRAVPLLSEAPARLVGITSGGAWLAERLHKDLGLEGVHGTISSSMHRDDFAQRGLAAGGQTKLHLMSTGPTSYCLTMFFIPGVPCEP